MNDSTNAAVGAGLGAGMMIVWLAVTVFFVIVMWKIFTKAGQPGWGCLIPFYNLYLLLKIAGKPGWWLILFFIPLVNLIIVIITLVALAANFGKGAGFAIGMLLLPIIFYPILAFGSATYQGAPAT